MNQLIDLRMILFSLLLIDIGNGLFHIYVNNNKNALINSWKLNSIPIDPSATWTDWPRGKTFAFVC